MPMMPLSGFLDVLQPPCEYKMPAILLRWLPYHPGRCFSGMIDLPNSGRLYIHANPWYYPVCLVGMIVSQGAILGKHYTPSIKFTY